MGDFTRGRNRVGLREDLLKFQRNEITEHHIYRRLAERQDGKNKEILERIAHDEMSHYNILKKRTGEDVKPNSSKIFWYILLSYIFGLTFALKAMERGEKMAQENYEVVEKDFPEIARIIKDEERHELELINLIDEERIGYISSMVLGLNDAIVELTGTLAGLTFALRNSSIVGLAGLITGISAALSMAVSEYLSQKSEAEEGKSPLKAAIYTGIAYIVVVVMLVLPFFLLPNPFIAVGVAIAAVVFVIAAFTYFVAVVKEQKYSSLFLEMLSLSMGVMMVAFVVGLLARKFLGIEV